MPLPGETSLAGVLLKVGVMVEDAIAALAITAFAAYASMTFTRIVQALGF
jgi:hypothetical protein